ncbi:MAG TPA: hypothetical protein VGG19_02960 [Tepidisphaeraceae bacterium]|jgi:hypothetical protein
MNQTAIHEAAHAIAAEVLDIDVREVWSRPDHAATLNPVFDVDLPSGACEMKEHGDPVKMCVPIVAGAVALEIYKRGVKTNMHDVASSAAWAMLRDGTLSDDLKNFKASLSAAINFPVLNSEFTATMLLNSCEQAATILRKHWDAVCGLAIYLDGGKSASGDFVRAVAGLRDRPKKILCQLSQTDLTGSVKREFCETVEIEN